MSYQAWKAQHEGRGSGGWDVNRANEYENMFNEEHRQRLYTQPMPRNPNQPAPPSAPAPSSTFTPTGGRDWGNTEDFYQRWKSSHEAGEYQGQPWNPAYEQQFQDFYNQQYLASLTPDPGDGGGGGGGGGSPRPYIAPMSEHESLAMDKLRQYMGLTPGDLGPIWGQAQGLLSQLLKGEPTPGFETHVADPLRARFEENVLPGIAESYVGPGTYWGSERAGAETKASTSLERDIGMLRYGAHESALSRALQATGPAMAGAQWEFGLPLEQAKAGVTIGALPRLLEQGETDFAYRDFLRTQGGDNSMLQFILGMLGMNTQAVQPGSNWLADLLGGALGGAQLGGALG